MKALPYLLLSFAVLLMSCDSDDGTPNPSPADFGMGFTSWSYGPTQQAVDETYQFIADNADIYAEHIDNNIPWSAWINDESLPVAFTNEILGKVNKKIPGKQLLLSVSVLTSNRDEIASDLDGSTPQYSSFNDEAIRNAYFKHIDYLVSQFQPDYLVIAIEVNELRLRGADKWDGYKAMIQNVTSRIKEAYPSLPISESVSLHNLFEPTVDDPDAYINEIIAQMNNNDFAAISFYPFFKSQNSRADFQEALDFLHDRITKPIAFVETAHIAEDLVVPNFNLSIPGNPAGQNEYLETLLDNASEQDYEFIIWWAHRDFDALWQTFPNEIKDLGQLWRDTGLLDENGAERPAMTTWRGRRQ